MAEKTVKRTPVISPSLLWEYNLQTFDYEKSVKVVVERVIERGTLADWREMFRYYGKDEILRVARSSKQLSAKDKNFAEIFLGSPLVYAS